MKILAWLIIPVLASLVIAVPCRGDGGITPEQIYQPSIDWKTLIGTWEVLPDDNPLSEKPASVKPRTRRALISLRQDGTCRIFNDRHPAGSDGMWTFQDHKVFIRFPNADKLEYYVYGIKGDFMVTRSNGTEAKHLLWSRVR